MGQSPDSKTYNEEGAGLPFYQGNADFGEVHPITRVWCSSPAKVASEGDILISVRAPIGAMNIATETCCIGRGLAALTANKERCNRQFLFYALQSKVELLISKGTGSTFKAISKKILEETLIPIYSIKEQEEIADKIEHIDQAITDRKKQLVLLERLVKSRFIELFGDTETNPMSWPIVSIGSTIASCEAGWSGNGQQRQKKPGEIAVLKVSAVTKGYFIQEECKVLDDQANIKKYVFPQKGDLLFSRANTREMVGATAVITEDFPELILPDKLWKIRFTEAANTWYMKYILSSKTVRDRFSAASTGTSGSMYNISMEKFKTVQIPMPSLELQNEFAAFAEQVDKSKYYSSLSYSSCQMAANTYRQEWMTCQTLIS
jgi:type I restriction enzyme S subunit